MNRQKGVALITAMLITALVASVALGLAWDSALDVRRTMVLLHRDQAAHVAMGAESWVQTILTQDLQDSETDHLGEVWATELPGLPIEGGEVFGAVEDLQGRFNVNNLVDGDEVDEEALDQFRRLLEALGIDPRFAGITADWIDPDQEVSFPDGAEDTLYSTQIPPYRTADRPIADISELAAIDGMDKQTFDLLRPHIVALPGRTGINVNTATPAVLQSLSDSMTAGDVERLVQERADLGFTDVVNTFSSLVEPEVLNELLESSEFFQLKVSVRIDTVRVTYSTTFQRGPRGDVVPILRSFGSI
ncbi:MAG: type II secretion system minor pseudopilin GspK [Woeseiaceae bacterium]|nr:type II secretion system minor pseudopilin GspK [Woeseiaceae bacterium]